MNTKSKQAATPKVKSAAEIFAEKSVRRNATRGTGSKRRSQLRVEDFDLDVEFDEVEEAQEKFENEQAERALRGVS